MDRAEETLDAKPRQSWELPGLRDRSPVVMAADREAG
jgi:hypothetical protein